MSARASNRTEMYHRRECRSYRDTSFVAPTGVVQFHEISSIDRLFVGCIDTRKCINTASTQ